ncbi:MAG: hypothetical protein O3B43_02400 [Chloroflexi bacterium]|nr:hypothetical protein [Chloroflexota bacterium]
MFWRSFQLTLALLSLLVLGNESHPLIDPVERVRAHTRALEFDFVTWTLDAAATKLTQGAVKADAYMDDTASSRFVLDYMDIVWKIQTAESELSLLHANPDPASISAQLEETKDKLADLYAQRDKIAPLAENILQRQIAAVANDLGLAFGGQPIPPVLFHSTPLPWALIVSRRDAIQQDANISLETDLVLEDHITLENEVASALNVSTLVVPVGGVGTYPSMVAQSSNLNWLAEVVAHEWIHNYLTLHPLGLLYNRDQELRTLNETTANLAGKEMGAAVIERFYPQLVPAPPAPPPEALESGPLPQNDPPAFDFRAEMHATRVRVDELLVNGRINQAEAFMEARRVVFWDHGYPIRKLNQAYFAFYGSYADSPTGPAGEDPVGAAVRELRARSQSLADFVQRMAFITGLDQLQTYLASLD